MKPTCTALLFVLASSAVLAQNGAPAPNGGFATPGSETTQPVPPSPPSANVPAQKANQYLAIGPFTDNHLSGQGFVDANGRPTYLKFFRVQFRVVDRSVASLEQANIYLFDDSKQLVGTMTSQFFGHSTTARNPRTIELGLRFNF